MTPPAQPSQHAHDLVVQARAALARNDPRQAHEFALRVLQREPEHAEAHAVAGQAALEARQLPQALDHLHRAASLAPRHPGYAVQFARALVRAHRSGDALQVANIALSLAPDDAPTLDALGTVYSRCHAHERAASVYRRAAALTPDHPGCRFNHAMSLTFGGDTEAAEAELEAVLALAPTHWRAHGALSRLRRQTRERNHVDRLLALAGQTADDPAAQTQLHMALGKEYEDLGDYTAAFAHLGIGNAASRGTRDYSIARDEAIVEALIRTFPESQPQAAGYRSSEPIFVFGMPRSGTTLVERILSSHPEVHAAGELENFGVALERLSGCRSPVLLSPEVIQRARNIPHEQLGEHYLASTRPMTSNKPRFIDKLPHNFLYAGFIANALPNARMICLRRNPLDTCLGNFREPFADTSPFHGYSFDLLDIGRYYILFDRLMTHWRRVLPGRILEVRYETLVATQEVSSRQLLEHCELPWNEACLLFERNQAPATTASSLQVRAPIHQSAVRRWKQYETQLAELRELLTGASIDCDQ